MKWALVEDMHINMNNVDSFKWKDGILYIWFNAECDSESCDFVDTDRKLYIKLCRQLGIRPYEEPATVTREERCVCCGRVIPEGRQVCPTCEGKTV